MTHLLYRLWLPRQCLLFQECPLTPWELTFDLGAMCRGSDVGQFMLEEGKSASLAGCYLPSLYPHLCNWHIEHVELRTYPVYTGSKFCAADRTYVCLHQWPRNEANQLREDSSRPKLSLIFMVKSREGKRISTLNNLIYHFCSFLCHIKDVFYLYFDKQAYYLIN